MKRLPLALWAVLIMAIPALAVLPVIQRDGGFVGIQGFAANPKKDTKLTVTAKTINMSSDLAWQVRNASSGCIFAVNTTATNVGMKRVMNVGMDGGVVNHIQHGFRNNSTASLTFTNCSSATLERQ